MTCGDADKSWARLLAEDLEPAQERAFEDHLAGCAACRGRQAARERALARFSALPRTEPPASVWEGIERKIGREMTAPPRRPARRWWMPAWGIGVAAAVLAVVIFNPAGPAFAPGQVVESGADDLPLAIRGLTLAPHGRARLPAFDGDPVHLEAGRLKVDRSTAIRVEASGAVIAVRDGRCEIVRRDGLEAELRTERGSALLRGEDGGLPVPAGTWVGVYRGRAIGHPAPLADYESFVRTRREAFESGRGDEHEFEAAKGDLLRRGDPRLLAALAHGRWERVIKPAADRSDALGAALLEAFVEGSRAGLPEGWFFRDSEEHAAQELREGLLQRLEKLFTPLQMAVARELLEGED